MTKTKAKSEPTYLLDCVLPPTDVIAERFFGEAQPGAGSHRFIDWLLNIQRPLCPFLFFLCSLERNELRILRFSVSTDPQQRSWYGDLQCARVNGDRTTGC